MEPGEIIRFVAALILVLGLMGGLAWLMRRFGQGGPVHPHKERRLKVLEILPLDHRRKAVLLQRDDKAHLVILGATGETVVERYIETKGSHAPDN